MGSAVPDDGESGRGTVRLQVDPDRLTGDRFRGATHSQIAPERVAALREAVATPQPRKETGR